MALPIGGNMKFYFKITLVDSFNNRSSLTWDLGDFTTGGDGSDFEAAIVAKNQIRGALDPLTDANVSEERLWAITDEDNQLPAGEVLISEEAVVFTHLNAPTEAQKLYSLRIPAPTQATVFLADGKSVNPASAQLVQYVQQISQHATVSDGETINTSSGAYGNGIAEPAGYLRTKSRKYS